MEKDLLIVNIQGGLGNQMFQYAFGKALAKRHGVPLLLNPVNFELKNSKRLFGLGEFNIDAKVASQEQIKSLMTPHLELRKKLKKVFGIPYKLAATHIMQKKFSFDKNLFDIPLPALFDGFWQSEKFFADAKDEVRKDFTFAREKEFSRNPLFGQIEGTESVSLHFRRGDYVRNRKLKKRFSVCRRGYFLRAAEYIAARTNNPKFFIFSDEPEWVKENFQLKANCVSVKTSGQYEDLFLMSRCKHNIISNSSFSWWGAWLNPNKQKTVIAPDIWFTPKMKADFSDVVPSSWVKIDSGFFTEEDF